VFDGALLGVSGRPLEYSDSWRIGPLDSRTPLRVGLVGFGEIAQYHLRHLESHGASVVGVVTTRPTPPHLRRFESFERMLPEVDAITLAVPNHLHADLCVRVMVAGTPALVEKPLCISAEGLAAVEATVPVMRAPIRLGYRLRFNPAIRALKARLHAPREVRCTYRLGIERLARGKEWTRRTSESGGAFFTLGVHALDLARWLANANGQPLHSFHSSAGARDASADFPLLVSARGTLPNGAAIEAAADLRGDAPFQLEIAVDGTRVDLSESGWAGPAPEQDGAADAEYAGLIGDFILAIRTGSTDRDAMLEVIESHRELLAARELTATAR
jgi:predicted dehydrogenase